MIRLVGHVACIGETRNSYKILDRTPGVKRLHGDIGRITLKRMGGYELDSPASGQGHTARSCEHDNETSVSIKGKKSLAELSKCYDSQGVHNTDLVSLLVHCNKSLLFNNTVSTTAFSNMGR